MFPGWPSVTFKHALHKSSGGAWEHEWVLLKTKLTLHCMVQYWTDLFMEDICEEYDCLQLYWTAPLLVTSSQSFETLVSFNKHLKGNQQQHKCIISRWLLVASPPQCMYLLVCHHACLEGCERYVLVRQSVIPTGNLHVTVLGWNWTSFHINHVTMLKVV